MHNSEELVSVIVPVYNERRHLEECVKSITNQTWENIEIILVDDGSFNGAEKDCDILQSQDTRMKVIHKNNQGLSAARIDGLKIASGSWVMFVDDDDVIAPNMIEDMISYSSNENLDIIAGGRVDTESVKDVRWSNTEKVQCTVEEGRKICEKIGSDGQKTIITPLWGKLYRKEFLNRIDIEKYREICPTIFFEDVLMTPILYYYARKICIIFRPYYIHREVATSISRSGKLTSFYYEQIESGNILLEFYKQKNIRDMYRYELGIYLKSILRVWCLMDETLEREQKAIYQKRIKENYKKYIADYLKYSYAPIGEKILFGVFGIEKNLWKKLLNRLYFQRKKR